MQRDRSLKNALDQLLLRHNEVDRGVLSGYYGWRCAQTTVEVVALDLARPSSSKVVVVPSGASYY